MHRFIDQHYVAHRSWKIYLATTELANLTHESNPIRRLTLYRQQTDAAVSGAASLN
jgi:hypothetical protein